MAILRFSVFEIDSASGELTKSGRRVPIAAQPLTALLLLADRPHAVVTRAELRRALWDDNTHVDFERGLNFCIASLRRALGDDARRPRFIETIPGRGYRFIAEVRQIESLGAQVRGAGFAEAILQRWTWAAVVALAVQVPSGARVHTRETAAPEAVAAFERGQKLWDRDAPSRFRSLREFEAAARIDGRFAEAHYAVAATMVDLVSQRALPAGRALVQAEDALRRAVTLEDVTASRQALSQVRLMRDWDWASAQRELVRAVQLSPASDAALVAYARVLSARGDDAAAIETIDRAEALNPQCDELAYQAALIHYRARNYDAALQRLDAAGPSIREIPVNDLRFLIHVQQQDWPSAQRDAMVLTRLYGARDHVVRHLGEMEPRAAVKRFISNSMAATRPGTIRGTESPTRMALLATLNGHLEEAMAWVERAVADRDVELVYELRHPAFEGLRGLPRFMTIEAQVRGHGAGITVPTP